VTARRPGHLFLSVLLLAACSSVSLQRDTTSTQLRKIFTDCGSTQTTGYTAVARCAEAPVRALYESIRYPYIDLVDLYLAHWISLAQKVDGGQLSPEEAQLQLNEQLFRISGEAQKRDGAYDTYRVLLTDLRPTFPPRR
jgi:hypothetical protein